MKIGQNVYEWLNFSHVKFYHNLSAGFENLVRKPRNFGDNIGRLPVLCFSKNDCL